MKTLDLNSMGMQSMSEYEMIEVEGGGFWDILGVVAGALAAVGLVVAALGGGWGVFLAGAALSVLGGVAGVVATVIDPNSSAFGDFMDGLGKIVDGVSISV